MSLPSDIDAAFVPNLYAVAAQLNSEPLNLAMSLYMESNIKASIQNLQGLPYYGINQMSAANLHAMGITPEEYLKLPASQQLCHYVFPFWKSIMAQHHLSQLSARDIEWLNYVPAYYVPNAPDDHVIMNSANPNYNKGFDHGNKGYITAGDIGTSVANACKGNRWLAIQAAILAGNPGIVGGVGGALIAIGLGIFLMWKGIKG